MAKRALGSDPLDWIGKPGKGDSRAGAPRDSTPSPATTPATGARTRVPRDTDLQLVEIETMLDSACAPGASSARRAPHAPHAPHAPDAPSAPSAPGTLELSTSCKAGSALDHSLHLERELLLMDTPRELPRERSGNRAYRFNRMLSVLLLGFAFSAVGAWFYREAKSGWNEQVVTLEGTIEQLERRRNARVKALENQVARRDELIDRKDTIIEKLHGLTESQEAQLALAWTELEELRSEFSRIARLALVETLVARRFIATPEASRFTARDGAPGTGGRRALEPQPVARERSTTSSAGSSSSWAKPAKASYSQVDDDRASSAGSSSGDEAEAGTRK